MNNVGSYAKQIYQLINQIKIKSTFKLKSK